MLRLSKHERSGLYAMLSMRALAFAHVALREPQCDTFGAFKKMND